MSLFVVTVEGVYRHEIIGIYDAVEKADTRALEYIKAERDDYHDVSVHKCNINTPVDDVEVLFTYSRKGEVVTRMDL